MRLLAFLLCFATTLPLSAARKDLLLIVLDDIGSDQMFYNTNRSASVAPMPNLRALAQSGTRLNGFRSEPVCSPTRAGLLTGRWACHHGIKTNDGTTFPTSEFTIADDLNVLGYATACIGKWGLGAADGNNTPKTRGGFDYFAGLSPVSALWPGNYYSYNWTVDGATAAAATTYITTKETDAAISWINAQSGDWFCWLAYHAAHPRTLTGFQFPPSNLTTYADDGSTTERAYRATIEAVDSEIGRLLASIDTSNAVIVVIGDNGSHYINPPNVNGTKGSVYDDSRRVPCIIKGPGIQSNVVVNQPCSVVDLYPTLQRFCGEAAPTSPNALDGRDVSGLLTGLVVPQGKVWTAEVTPGVRSVTDGDYHLVDYPDNTPDLFFDLSADPHETSTLGTTGLTGAAADHLNNLRYALTFYTANAVTSEVTVNFSRPAPTPGGIQVVPGALTPSNPTAGSATITSSTVSGATDYTLWRRATDQSPWEATNITETVVGSVVSFIDPSPVGRPTYRVTNNAPEP